MCPDGTHQADAHSTERDEEGELERLVDVTVTAVELMQCGRNRFFTVAVA